MRHLGWLGLALAVGGVGQVWAAEPMAIFRKSDRLYVGKVHPPQTMEQEIFNLTRSDLGGTSDDYVAVPMPVIPQGHRPVLKANGKVETEAYPEVIQKQQAKASGVAKLKALGLTDEEIEALR